MVFSKRNEKNSTMWIIIPSDWPHFMWKLKLNALLLCAINCEFDKCKLRIRWKFSKATSFNVSFVRLKWTLKVEVVFPVLLASIFIGEPAKRSLLWRTALLSVYIHLILLLREAQRGTLCRAIQVQQTLQSCLVVYKCNRLYIFSILSGLRWLTISEYTRKKNVNCCISI
jgi:hypothetical protein